MAFQAYNSGLPRGRQARDQNIVGKKLNKVQTSRKKREEIQKWKHIQSEADPSHNILLRDYEKTDSEANCNKTKREKHRAEG